MSPRRYFGWKSAFALTVFAAGLLTGLALSRAKLRKHLLPQPQPVPVTTHHGLSAGRDLPVRVPLPVSVISPGGAVLLTFGQSNSANHGDARYVSGGKVFNHYLGELYPAMDPLLGATGSGGSIWTRLGDLLTDELGYDYVIVAPIGVGSSEIQRWAPGGDLHPLLIYTLRDLRDSGHPVTHLLFIQGESDHSTGSGRYRDHLSAMVAAIRSVEPEAPLFISQTSLLRGRVSASVRVAQKAVLDREMRVFPGPDTDALGSEFRNASDRTHFNARGLDACALLWLDIIGTMSHD